MVKKVIVFLIAVAVSLLAAGHRWNDSAHAIGLIRAGGGTARHPVTLTAGRDSYTLIVTARVLQPYAGDVRVTLEGTPAAGYELYPSHPVVDFGLSRWPQFRDNTFYGLKPGDRIALWVRLAPARLDPVCGMADGGGFIRHSHRGREYRFCSEGCLRSFEQTPERYREGGTAPGRYALAFYDVKTAGPVLSVPVVLAGKEGAADAGERHH